MFLQTFGHWISQNVSDWMPRAHCVDGNPVVIGLHIISELMIGAAYYSIPIFLYYIIKKNGEFFDEYKQLFYLFSVFIFLCGTTHLVGILMFWYPIYWIDGGLKFITGLISLFTSFALFMAVPKLMNLASRDEVEQALHDKETAEKKIEILEENLNMWTKNTSTRIEHLKNELKDGDERDNTKHK